MSDNRELLELAAKAAGIELLWHVPEGDGFFAEPAWCFIPDCKPPHNRRARDKDSGTIWNPLTDDGDAFRLAVKLHITPIYGFPNVAVCAFSRGESDDPDPYAATRLAIVRAAAEMGRGVQ